MTRWRLPDPSEEAERAEILARIDAWWRAFARRADDIDAHFKQGREIDIPAFMKHLHAVDERLCWEFGPPVKGTGHRLVITPESERQLRPMVEVLLSRAPKLPRWEFFPYRQPEDLDGALGSIQGRTKVDFAGTRVRLLEGETTRIGLEFHSPACRHPEDDKAGQAGFVAAESLLGEEILDTWIGVIRTVPLRKPGLLGRLAGKKEDAGLLTLDAVKAEVDRRIEAALARLPDSPRYLDAGKGDDASGAVFKLQPKEREYRRCDLFVAVSECPEVFQERHGPGIFASRRLSRFGETFCYLKIAAEHVPENDRLRFRAPIEDALNAALRPAELGGTIGGGTGRRYSYVDLALMDVDAALPVLRRVLRERDVPQRSWLLFFDDDLADEWAGIWDETPPPPGPPEGEDPS